MKQTVIFIIIGIIHIGNPVAQVSGIAGRGTGIVVDGSLSDAAWTSAKRFPLKHDVDMQLTHGSVDDHNDGSGEFSVLWDDEGLYCASWCKDDIHNAPWTNEQRTTTYSWNDDGHEWWVTPDFSDVWEDASPPYFGNYGYHVFKGWTWANGACVDNYVAWHNDNNLICETTADMKEKGFESPFTSTDGINFNTEAHWKWSGFLFGSMPTPSTGTEIGFNLGLVDNDGGDMGDAYIRWAEGNQNEYQGWGKMTLSDKVSIRRPGKTAIAAYANPKSTQVYDILGRRIAPNIRIRGSVLFSKDTRISQKAVILH